jgi:hypothetical protein
VGVVGIMSSGTFWCSVGLPFSTGTGMIEIYSCEYGIVSRLRNFLKI